MLKPIFGQTDKIKLNRNTGIILLIFFFISRVIFINATDVFFDSKEYLDLFANPNFAAALIGMHYPLHEGYMFLFWPVFQAAIYFYNDPSYIVILAQIFLATITVYCYYKVIAFISDTNTALLSTIIISLTPLFWITNVTITIETSYISFFFISLYFFTKYLTKNKNIYIYLSAFFLAYSFLTYSAVLMWVPIYLCLGFYEKRNKLLKIFIILFFSLTIFSLVRVLILASLLDINPFLAFHNVYLANITQAGTVESNVKGLLILIRNFIPVLRNYTSIVFISSILSLILSYLKNKKIFFIGLLWIIPVIYANQWWDSVIMGRYSLLAGFGFAFLTGYFINRYRILAPMVMLYMLLVTLPVLFLLKSSIPYIQEEQFVESLPKNGLLIESHFALPQLEHCCQLKILGVNRPDVGNTKLIEAINENLKNKKPVYVSSAALSDPYGLYTGPYLHPLSLSYDHPFTFTSVLALYKWKVIKVINKKDNLIMYQILAHGKSQYPQVMNLQRSYRRLDYYDPTTRLWWTIQDLLSSGK